MYNQVVEGYIILYKDILWMVKGCEHPTDGFIAYPRYFKNGDKIKDPVRGIEIARELGFTRYIDGLKMEVPVISRTHVDLILDPFSKALWTLLPKNVSEFLSEINAFDSDDIGLTGSYLVSHMVPVKPRDLDLIIRGEREGLRVYNVLRDLREKGLAKPYIESKDFSGTDAITRNELLKHRILEGVFKDELVYSIRILSCTQNTEINPILRVDYYSGTIKIQKALSPFIMPYVYEALSNKGIMLVKSQRMRFSEISIGMEFLLSSCRIEYYDSGSVFISLDNPECKVTLVGFSNP